MGHSIFALTKNFNDSHVIENVSFLKGKALWKSDSKVWFLIQIIVILDFNCCYGWGKKKPDTMQRCIDPSGKTAILAVLTKPLSLFFILIHQLCKVFCWNSASKFPSSLMSISSSCKLIKRCYIFIFLANRFWNTLFEKKFF